LAGLLGDLRRSGLCRTGRRTHGGAGGRIQLIRGLVKFALHRVLDAAHSLLHAVLHLAQFVELDFAVDVGLDVGDIALQPAGKDTERARDARQALRPDHDQRDQADNQQFRKTDVEHGALRTKVLKHDGRPAGARANVRQSLDQALDSVLPLTSPSTVLPLTCGAAPVSAAFSPVCMPSLKPRTAPPRSAPMLRSFLVPKTSITITRTISQCQMLNEPILPPISFSEASVPGAQARRVRACGHDTPPDAPPARC